MNEFLVGFRPSLLIGWWKLWKSIPVIDWIRGAELFRSGEFKRARFYYERGLKRHTGHAAASCARLDFAYCLYQDNELPRAISELEKLTSTSTHLKDAYLLLAKLQLITGKSKDAVFTMKRCLSIAPEDVQAALCYAHAMFESEVGGATMKLVKDFVGSFREKLSLDDPMHVAVDTALATYECLYGDEELGERLLARALASGVAPFEAIILRGERWLEQGRVTQSREQLERAAKCCPSDPRPYMRLAETYLLEGELLEPEYAVQLATVACKRSNWQHRECLEVLRRGYIQIGDRDMVELIEDRLQSLAPEIQIQRLEEEDAAKQRIAKHQLM